MLRSGLIICFIASLLCCCTSPKKEASYYYWKTVFKLNAAEKEALTKTNSKTLYVRFFDVDRKNDLVQPLGVISGLQELPDSISCIPVVFITNRTLLGVNKEEVRILSQNISKKIRAVATHNKVSFSEFQIDCDWSEKTRIAYFDLLKQLKEQLPGKTLSVTIRLHQVKYPVRSGVPPADKGMLMFYNMGKLNDNNRENSIYNRGDAEKYVSYIKSYALPLDYALPVFSWQKQVRNNKLIALVSKDEIPDTNNAALLLKQNAGSFKIKSPFLHKGRYFMEGDELTTERITKNELLEAAQLLNENSDKTKEHRIVFFDLDSINIKQVSYETISEVLDLFN